MHVHVATLLCVITIEASYVSAATKPFTVTCIWNVPAGGIKSCFFFINIYILLSVVQPDFNKIYFTITLHAAYVVFVKVEKFV